MDEVIFNDVLFSFLLIISLTLVSIFSLKFILKNKFKSTLFVSLALVFFFSYGYFAKFIVSLNIDVSSLPFSHTTIILPIYFIIFGVITIGIIKIKNYYKDITIFVNIISVVFLLILLPNVISDFQIYDYETMENPLNYRITDNSNISKPDIYYFILDEYTSDEILLDIYNYDNHDFLKNLSDRGFIIPSISFTNYATSPLAISAFLNMDYIENQNVVPTLDNKNIFYNQNQIMRILKSLDYKIISYTLEYPFPEVADYHLCPPTLFVNQFHSTLLDYSIWLPFSKFFNAVGDSQRDKINCQLSLIKELGTFESPIFVFNHIMSPHPPYIFGPNGESRTPQFLSIGADSWSDKPGYVGQVQNINKKIIDIVDQILEVNPNSIIVIQGDHGTPTQLGGGGLRWNNINDDSIYERMSILNAYYLPNVDNKIIYEGITPVNSFRLILNTYLNGDYELLEDKMYFSTYQDMQNFTDVTHLFQK